MTRKEKQTQTLHKLSQVRFTSLIVRHAHTKLLFQKPAHVDVSRSQPRSPRAVTPPRRQGRRVFTFSPRYIAARRRDSYKDDTARRYKRVHIYIYLVATSVTLRLARKSRARRLAEIHHSQRVVIYELCVRVYRLN